MGLALMLVVVIMEGEDGCFNLIYNIFAPLFTIYMSSSNLLTFIDDYFFPAWLCMLKLLISQICSLVTERILSMNV